MSVKMAKAGGLALVFYVLLFEFLAGTRWAGFPRLILVGFVAVILLLQRKRMGWFGWGAVAVSGIWLILACGPGGNGVLSRAVAPDGSEMCLVQGYSGKPWQPYRISFYCRRPGQNWVWYYYDHKDTRWWYGSIKLDKNGTHATIRRLLRSVSYFDLPTESLTLVRWGRDNTSSRQRMKPGWEPAKHCSWLPEILYLKPKVLYVTYSFEFSADPNKIDRSRDIKLWLPLPREWESQKPVKILSVEPSPDGTYEDPESGNRMAFWDFGKGPEKARYTATIKYRVQVYKTYVEVYPRKVGTYDKSSPEYVLYTRSEPSTCIMPKVQEMAREAVGDETNPYLQAICIAKYVHKKVHYKIHEIERGNGIECLLAYPVQDAKTGEEYYEGSCAQYSILFVALCRAVGIPARSVSGCLIGESSLLYTKNPRQAYDFETQLSPDGLGGSVWFSHASGHVWSEFYLPQMGWIPVDTTYGGSIASDLRLVLAKGNDIKVGPDCPEEDSEGYGSQWTLLHEGRACKFMRGVWNIAIIRNPKVTVTFAREP
jgi:transglutaminase-like putative cysteine protease